MKILKNRFIFIYGILSFLSFSFSMLIGPEDELSYPFLARVKAGLILVSSILYLLSCNKDSGDRIKRQYSLLSLVILIYEILLLIAVGRTIIYIRDYPAILNSIMWISCSLYSIVRFRANLAAFFSGIIRNRETVFLILVSTITAALVILLSVEPTGIMFSWDSDTLYSFINRLDLYSLYDAKTLKFYSHVSIVYSHLIVLFKELFGSTRLAFFTINSLCIILASFGMTFLLKVLIPGKRVLDYALGSAVFMFSPWVCGMSTYHIYDYYIWCLFPVLIYFVYKNDWIWVFVTGSMITFSKASGLIVFGGVCIGILTADIISFAGNKTKKVSKLIPHLLSQTKYWCFLSIALVFLVYFGNGVEELSQIGDTSYGLNIRHIWHQTKLYSVSNMIWIPIILTISMIVYCFVLHKDALSPQAKQTITIALISDLVFFVFNCICITYRMPRYMDSHIAVVFICALVLLLSVKKNLARYSVLPCMIALSAVGSFRTIDPVSLLLFNRINVGDHCIIDYEMTTNPSFEDSIVCNREYYSYEVLLDKVLTYVIDSKKDGDEIMFSLGNQTMTWGVSVGRYSYAFNAGEHYFDLFYDKNRQGLANGGEKNYSDPETMTPFCLHYIFPQESLGDAVSISPSDTFYYIYMPTINDGKEKEISQKYNTVSETSFDFRGWKMNCIKFTR